VATFHIFSGFPIAVLFFQNKDLGQQAVGWAFVVILLLHILLPRYMKDLVEDERTFESKYRRTPLTGSRAVRFAQIVIYVLVVAVTVPHFYINLLYSQRELRGILEKVDYAGTLSPDLAEAPATACSERFRAIDGSCNNLQFPQVGKAGTALRRYIPEAGTVAQDVLGEPSAIAVSNRLNKQEEFNSAAPVSTLAFAWVNFFVHDFYARGNDSFGRPTDDFYKLPTGDGKFVYMSKLATAGEGVHLSNVTHWFDGSQVYGSSQEVSDRIRTVEDGKPGAKLRFAADGFLPRVAAGGAAMAPAFSAAQYETAADSTEEDGEEPQEDAPGNGSSGREVFLTGDSPRSSLHIGLLMLHHLWAAEHNYLVDQLRQRYPQMSAEELFQTARLIVGAEIAKIHTVEWTAQMTFDPVSAEFVNRIWTSRAGDAEAYRPDVHYAVSEEFVSSYVLHEIVPVRFEIVDGRGGVIEELSFVEDLFATGGQDKLLEHGVENIFNSFGTNEMGLIYPFNVPDALRRFTGLQPFIGTGNEDDAGYLDLAAIPIARDRDARVPKYNDLREVLNQPRLSSIDEMTRDQEVVKALKELYGSIDDVEYIIGFKAEERPSTWALPRTEVVTFLPVVAYRIVADRFYTVDFRAEIYTEYGIGRLTNIRLHDIIAQHYGPALLPADRDAPIFYLWDQ
ncbi:MAG: peroxidase family protein, partial [Thermoanaerobaculia bacterium]